MPRVNLLLALLWLPFVVGCEGCRRDPDQDPEELDAPLDDFSSRPPQPYPTDAISAGAIKPGHWLTAAQTIKSNKIDARGNLLSRASASSASGLEGKDLTVPGEIPSMRPVVLPKGQSRRFDYRILCPLPASSDQQRNYLDSRLLSGGRSVFPPAQSYPFEVLGRDEVFFVVLTDRPERFAKYQVADWIRPLRDEFAFKDPRSNYRVVIPPTDGILPLAETMLDWTGTAVILWDDLSPDALTPQQQTAITDWIRFGGQLIVNGADASDAVAKTSLAGMLPLTPTGNSELDHSAAAKMLRGWSVKTDRSTDKQIALLQSQSGRIAVDGSVSPDAEAVRSSGDLVLTRRIGSGRIVQSRFDVTSDWLINWQSYDSFINAVFLARPRRALRESTDALDGSMIQQQYPDLGLREPDPAFNTKFRLASRDAVLYGSGASGRISSQTVSSYDPLTAIDPVSGISGWTDSSDVIALSREILKSESGIEIPKSSLVMRSLGYYLLILVPINYLFFRLIGRLEYAWLAVPVIAIGGAIWVARAARLDIGFARSQTEIGFLETHGGYPRGHLSRVVAIYNSLSSSYDIEFETMDAVAAPVRVGTTIADDGTTFKTGFASGPIVSGLPVISNKVRMLHSEQVIDLGGGIELDAKERLVNRSEWEFSDAVVVDKALDGAMRIAVVGSLGSGSAANLRFRPAEEIFLADDLPMQTSRMIEFLTSPKSMPKGSMRMVARYDGALKGMTISPDTHQTSSQTVVLTHLKYPAYAEPKPDVNLIGDFRSVLTEEDESPAAYEPPPEDGSAETAAAVEEERVEVDVDGEATTEDAAEKKEDES